jgi:hypothetical protein
VSEGRCLGEEGLGGRRIEEREESDGAVQISMDDGVAVLRKATGMSAQGGGARLRWLGRGREENGQKRGTGRQPALLKCGSVARGRGKGGGRGRVHVEAGKGG